MANSDGWVVVTRYDSTKNARPSRLSPAGNLAGKFDRRTHNSLNLFQKSPEFESSPGHQ